MKTWFAALLTLALAAPASAQAPAGELTGQERALAQQFRDGLALVKRHEAQIWPGYRPATFPVVFHRPGQVALLYMPEGAALPAGFQPVPGLAGVAFSRSARYNTGIDIKVPIGSLSGVTVELMDGGTAQTFTTAVHEAFHHHQQTRRFYQAKVHGQNHHDSSADRALAEIEQRLLSDALMLKDREASRKAVWRFLSVRLAREAKLPPSVREYQDDTEASEGTARYVEERAQIAAMGVSGPSRSGTEFFAESRAGVLAQLAADLRRDLSISAYQRDRFYETGAAMAYLLDGLAPGWHARAENGAALDTLLREASGFPIARQPEIFRQVGEWYPAAASVHRIEAFAARERERKEQFVRDFRQAAGRKVTFLVPAEGYSFSGSYPLELPGDEELYLPGTTISVERPEHTLEVKGLALHAIKQNQSYLTFYTAPASIRLQVDGKPHPLRPGQWTGAITFTSENARFTHAKGRVTIDEQGIRLDY